MGNLAPQIIQVLGDTFRPRAFRRGLEKCLVECKAKSELSTVFGAAANSR